MASLDVQIAKLRAVRDAWETILKATHEAGRNLVNRPSSTPTSSAAHTQAAPANPPAAYGDKTNSMRRFILGVNSSGVSRADLINKARNLTDTANFGYRFISRMLEAEELEERNGRYFATDRMRQKIAEIAA